MKTKFNQGTLQFIKNRMPTNVDINDQYHKQTPQSQTSADEKKLSESDAQDVMQWFTQKGIQVGNTQKIVDKWKSDQKKFCNDNTSRVLVELNRNKPIDALHKRLRMNLKINLKDL